MKTLICQTPGMFLFEERDIPRPNENEVLLKVNYIGICGTDIHAYHGRQPFFTYPRILGHEISATVHEVGSSLDSQLIGKACTVIPYIHCGQCHSCVKGKTNACENISVLGVHADGAMQEYIVVPRSHVVIVEELDAAHLAIIEPMSIAYHAYKRAKPVREEHIVIVGGGPIGLAAAKIALLKQHKVTIVEINEAKHEEIRYITRCLEVLTNTSMIAGKVDIVIDATGNKASMENTLNVISHGGTVVYVGLVQDEIAFHDPLFHSKEIALLASRNAVMEDFKEVIGLLQTNDFANRYISQIVPIDALPTLYEDNSFGIKTLVHF